MKAILLNLLSAVGAMFSGAGSVHDAVKLVGDAIAELHKLHLDVVAEIEAIKKGTPLPLKDIIDDVQDLAHQAGDAAAVIDPNLASGVAVAEKAIDAGGDALDALANALQRALGAVAALKAPK